MTQSASFVQLPRHAVPLHTYSPQSCVWSAGHEPAPSHFAPSVAVPAAHDGARHCVVPPGYVQAARVVPSHAPAQSEPSVAHAVFALCGVPVTGEHVPTLPATSHASHWPVHAPLQHTPSAQMPEMHELAVVQALPFETFGMQTPLLHQLPLEQSVSVVHDVLHAVAPHT